jgi:hypothetical protein
MIRRKYVDDGKVVALPSYPEEDWSMQQTRSTRSWSIYSTWFWLIAVLMIDCIPQGILPYQTWQRIVVVEVVVWLLWKMTPPGLFHPVTASKTCRNNDPLKCVPSTSADRIVSVRRRPNFPFLWMVMRVIKIRLNLRSSRDVVWVLYPNNIPKT